MTEIVRAQPRVIALHRHMLRRTVIMVISCPRMASPRQAIRTHIVLPMTRICNGVHVCFIFLFFFLKA